MPDFVFSAFRGNPWDLGPWGNLKEVLGSGWDWLLFWVRPRRVKNYRKNGFLANQSDFQMSADFMGWVADKRLEHSALQTANRTARTQRGRRAMRHSAESVTGTARVPVRPGHVEPAFPQEGRSRLVMRSEGGASH